MKFFKKKEKSERHVHCIICSAPLDTTSWSDDPIEYVCQSCVASFPYSYILERIECHRKGISKREFDILEYRLTWGDKNIEAAGHSDRLDGSDFYVANTKDWIK